MNRESSGKAEIDHCEDTIRFAMNLRARAEERRAELLNKCDHVFDSGFSAGYQTSFNDEVCWWCRICGKALR